MQQNVVTVRDILDVFWVKKTFIITITLVAVLVSGIFSYFVLPKVYEATSQIRLNIRIDDKAGPVTNLSLNTLIESSKGNANLAKVLQNLKLDGQSGQLKSVEVLRLKDTNIVQIRVTGTNNLTVKKVANYIAMDLTSNVERVELTNKITDDQTRITEVEAAIGQYDSEIQETSKQLQNNADITNKNLAQGTFLLTVPNNNENTNNSQDTNNSQNINNSDNKGPSVATQIKSDEVNSVYLRMKLSEAQINKAKATEQKENLEKATTDNRNRISEMDKNMNGDIINGTVPENLLKDSSTAVISPVQAAFPIGPKIVVNILVAGVLAFIIGGFIVLASEYLTRSKKAA